MQTAELLIPTEITTLEQQIRTWGKLKAKLRVVGETLKWDPFNKLSPIEPTFAQFQVYYGLHKLTYENN